MAKSARPIQFRSRSDVHEWAENKPRDVLVVFAARAALRVVPTFITLLDKRSSVEKKPSSATILSSLWAIGTALSAGTWPDKAVNNTYAAASAYAATGVTTIAAADAAAAAAAAYDAVTDADAATAATAAIDAADAAATYVAYDAPTYADYDAAATYAAAADAKAIENGFDAKRLAFTPLWENVNMPARVAIQWKQLKSALGDLNEDWSVWINWYESILKGGERNADLEIALISFPTADYTNAKVLNPKIKKILEDLETPFRKSDLNTLIDATPLAETISINSDGKFDIEFIPVQDLFNRNLNRLDDALEHIVKKNTFGPSSDEILFLKNIIENHSDDPQRIFDDCQFAYKAINSLVEKNIIDDGFSVKRLLNAVDQTINDIRAYEPSVQNVIAKREEIILDTFPLPIDTSPLSQNLPVIKNISTERLGNEIEHDTVQAFIGDHVTLIAGKEKKNALYRLISRYSRMTFNARNLDMGKTSTDAVNLAIIKAQPHLEAILIALKQFIPFLN